MSRFRVPFGATRASEDQTEAYDPGVVLAAAAEQMDLGDGGTREATVDTAWGALGVEARERGVLLAETPRVEVADAPVMLQAGCRRLGLDPDRVEATGAQMRVVDVGRRVLVVPLPDPEAVEAAPADADPGGVPAADAELGVAYAHTQTSPYSRVVARVWGTDEALAPLAAAATHLIPSGTMRPTYPRTRVVARLVGREDEEVEITVEAEKAGGTPKVTRVLVGGEVVPVDEA